jgi:hypothetical protein
MTTTTTKIRRWMNHPLDENNEDDATATAVNSVTTNTMGGGRGNDDDVVRRRIGSLSKKRLQKNCFECTRAHRRCVFELTNNNQCTRCVKFNLCCTFRVSGMFHFLLCLFFLDLFSNSNQLKTYCILHISEQGRRNDLNKLCSIPLSSNEQQVFPSPPDVSSDSVHCNALTQSTTVSYAFSCHTTDTCCEENDVESLAFASLQLVLPFHYAWEITCCFMHKFLIVFLQGVHLKMRLCAHQHI